MKSTLVHKTYLQMTHPPSDEVQPLGPGVVILHAAQPTASFYRYLYDTVGEPWNWVDRRRLSDEKLIEAIRDAEIFIYVLYQDGVPAGYVELNHKIPEEIEIAYFGLIPEFAGAGLGKLFLKWSIQKAWSHNVKRVWLHTCSLDHPAALPLYKKMGFVPYASEEYEFK